MNRNRLTAHEVGENIEIDHFNRNRFTINRDAQEISAQKSKPYKSKRFFQDKIVGDDASSPNIRMHGRKYEYHAHQAEMSLENHANRIVSKMEEDLDMMDDNMQSEMFTKETLKHMTQCLTVKRSVKRKLTESLNVRPKGRPISLWKRMKYRTSMKYSQMKLHLKNMIYTWELWYGSLKTIEGQFGSSTSSYFKFLRWLFLMNIPIMIITLIFIVLPEVSLRSTTELIDNLKDFNVWDILTGEGSFTNTVLYYGSYSSQTINIFGLPYYMPSAYFYTMLFLYVVSILILSYSVTQSYRKSFIQAEEGLKNVFGLKIFCGWDYSIATQEAAILNSKAVYYELKELLSEADIKNTDVSWTRTVKTGFIRTVTNILIFVVVTLAGGFLWILMEIHTKNDIQLPLIIAFVANFLNVILPMFFTKIASYENYKKQSYAVGVTLMRSFLLSTVIVGTLVIFWLTYSSKNECWETSLGQEMYRLIIFDFLLTLAIHVVNLVFSMVKRYCFKLPVVFEFDVASNTLDLIYSQSLFWVGFYFSPLLSVVVLIKIYLTWYLKQYYVLKVCQPSPNAWRASQAHTWFLTLTFLTALATECLMVFIITKIPPTDCGPFQGYKYFYTIILEIFNKDTFPPLMHIEIFTKPGVVTLIIVVLCVQVYYVKQKANGQRDVVKMMRNMIEWETKDKKFLLNHISKITKGEWQYNAQENRDEDPYNSVPKMMTDRHSSSGDIGTSTSRSNCD